MEQNKNRNEDKTSAKSIRRKLRELIEQAPKEVIQQYTTPGGGSSSKRGKTSAEEMNVRRQFKFRVKKLLAQFSKAAVFVVQDKQEDEEDYSEVWSYNRVTQMLREKSGDNYGKNKKEPKHLSSEASKEKEEEEDSDTNLYMFGAIVGDIVGSTYEYNNCKEEGLIQLFRNGSKCTDDSILTLATAQLFYWTKTTLSLLLPLRMRTMRIMIAPPHSTNTINVTKTWHAFIPVSVTVAAFDPGPVPRIPNPTTAGATGRPCGSVPWLGW